MTKLSASRKRKVRNLEDTINDFVVVCENELAFYDDWGGLTQIHYAEFLAQYCQTSPGDACQPQTSNFWNLDLQFQKTFLSPGCPHNAERNEQCIDYLLQNHPQTLLYAGNVTQLCEMTGSLLLTTGMMQFSDMEGDIEQEGRDSGNAPTTAFTATPMPSFAPSMNRSNSSIAETSESQQIDENNLPSQLLMHFGIVLIVFGLCLGMMLAYIRRLRHKNGKKVVVQSKKDIVNGAVRPQIPPTSSLDTNNGSPHFAGRNLGGDRIKRDVPRPALQARLDSQRQHKVDSARTPRHSCSTGESTPSRVPSCGSAIASIAETISLPSVKHATVPNYILSESKASREDEECSRATNEHETAATSATQIATEGPWIVECTHEEEDHLSLSMLRRKLNSTSMFEHCQLIEDHESGTCESNKSIVDRPMATRLMDEDNRHETKPYMTFNALDVELRSTETFDCSIRNGQGCDTNATESPAFCELVDPIIDTSSCKNDYIQPLTTSDKPTINSPRHKDRMSMVSVQIPEEPLCRFIGPNAQVEEVKKAAATSMSECKQPYIFVFESTVESEGCNSLLTMVAGKSDELICETMDQNTKVEEMHHKVCRTGVDPPDNDVVIGCHGGARIRIEARNPVSCQADFTETSDTDDNSTNLNSRSNALSVEGAKMQLHRPAGMPAILDKGLASGSTSSQLLEANLAMYSTCDRSEQSVKDCSKRNIHPRRPQISKADQTSIDAITETRQHSITQVHAITEETLSRHPHFQDISLSIQSCYSDLSMEEPLDKPRLKTKRSRGADTISIDTSSYSTEWSMESSIRQTFHSFKQNISHAIADLNDTTVDTISILQEAGLENKSTPHEHCTADS